MRADAAAMSSGRTPASCNAVGRLIGKGWSWTSGAGTDKPAGASGVTVVTDGGWATSQPAVPSDTALAQNPRVRSIAPPSLPTKKRLFLLIGTHWPRSTGKPDGRFDKVARLFSLKRTVSQRGS